MCDDSRVEVGIVLLYQSERHFRQIENSGKEPSNERVRSNQITDERETARFRQSNGNIKQAIKVQVDVVWNSWQTINENITCSLLRALKPISEQKRNIKLFTIIKICILYNLYFYLKTLERTVSATMMKSSLGERESPFAKWILSISTVLVFFTGSYLKSLKIEIVCINFK